MKATKAETLKAIEKLKREKPENWKFKVRGLIRRLERMEGLPRCKEQDFSTDQGGRHNLQFASPPTYDSFDEESNP